MQLSIARRGVRIRVRLCLAVGLLLAGIRSGRAQTWIQWKSADGGNNHYYALTLFATNWNAAEALAVSWGGTLATITSSNKQDFVNNTFLTGRFTYRPVWIGLFDPAPAGTFAGTLREIRELMGSGTKERFRWVTGEPFKYRNWKSGEPNNTPPGEYYVAINWEYSGLPCRGEKGDWNDTPLNGTTGYGGQTSGPYFGLVERDTDPSLPPKVGRAFRCAPFWLITVLVAVLAIWFTRGRRRERPRA
jgi:hypothetical protein